MFTFFATDPFKEKRAGIVENNEKLKKRLKTTLYKLASNPLHPSLESHKVNTPKHGVQWSSRITGDIRIIWKYGTSERLIIILLDIGGHSGSHKVYK